jgi:hypothetical protein
MERIEEIIKEFGDYGSTNLIYLITLEIYNNGKTNAR